MTFKLYRPEAIGRAGFEALIRPHFLPSEQELIMRAYRQAKGGHKNQMREGGQRYFEHVKLVTVILIMIGIRDVNVICAALLHDMIEDSYALTPRDIEVIFGALVAHIVQMVTKLDELPTEEYFARLKADGPLSWLVKLADRLHNMSTLVDVSKKKTREQLRQKKIEQVAETRKHILPLARKLARTNGYREIGKWFTDQLTAWCIIREQEALAG